jgi:mxaJ protein
MCSVSKRRSWLLSAWLCSAIGASAAARAQLAPVVSASAALRVCADPNNLPFSNERGEGFENALARLVASQLGKSLQYTWWPQRRGFIRNTLAAKRCDVVMGVPTGLGMLQTTRPYYRSSYVLVTRAADQLHVQSWDDARLRTARIGVHVIGDDYNNVPPAQLLAAHGLSGALHGYPIYGAYSRPDPPRELIDAVAEGFIDVAIAWGPLAGYFARIEPALLDVQALPSAAADERRLPMTFAISLGVRHGELALKQQLEAVLVSRADEIRALLTQYGVPLLDLPPTAADGGG